MEVQFRYYAQTLFAVINSNEHNTELQLYETMWIDIIYLNAIPVKNTEIKYAIITYVSRLYLLYLLLLSFRRLAIKPEKETRK